MLFFYRMLLRLYPARVREEFGLEMEEVFAEAWEERREQGGAEAAQFVFRELLGVLGGAFLAYPLHMAVWRFKWMMLSLMLLGAIGGVGYAVWQSEQGVQSTAVLQVNPPMISETLVPQPDPRKIVTEVTQGVLSRAELSNLINTYQLYPRQRGRMPLQDIIEKMREQDIQIKTPDEKTIEVSFRYPSHFAAQKVTAELATKILDGFVRARESQTTAQTEFFRTALQNAADDWDQKRNAVRNGGAGERQLFDLELAKKRYELMSQRLADARMAEELHKRRQGVRMEILDAATLPTEDEFTLYWMPPVGGFLGLMLGTMLAWLRYVMSERRRRKTLLAAQ